MLSTTNTNTTLAIIASTSTLGEVKRISLLRRGESIISSNASKPRPPRMPVIQSTRIAVNTMYAVNAKMSSLEKR